MSTGSQQQGQLGIRKTSNLLCDKLSESDDAGRRETSCDVQIEAGKDVDSPSEPKDLEIDATKSNNKGFTLLMTVMALALSMFLVSFNVYDRFRMVPC